jgi:DNA-binding NtrC family response regulator
VEEGEFREDLFYRLQVVILEAPPLRERREDIPALAEHFLELTCAENKLPRKTLSPAALERLAAHRYPGNVRELRNLIERLVILSPQQRIGPDAVEACLPSPRGSRSGDVELAGSLRETLAGVERQVVLRTLESHQWRMTAAASALGLERSHLYKKLKALGIEKPD